MFAIWAWRISLLRTRMAFCAIASPPCGRPPFALVILPFCTVICTCTAPYWVFTAPPMNVPAGAVCVGVGVGFGVVGIGAGVALVGVVAGAFVVGVATGVFRWVVAGAVGVV